MTNEECYRAFICPCCKHSFTPADSHLPTAPGSDEGLHCFNCKSTWGWWRQFSKDAKVIQYGKPSLWMKVQDCWKFVVRR